MYRRACFIIAAALLATAPAQGQTITTVAGSGPIGTEGGSFCGDGGAATSACLHHPLSVAADAGGAIFIADAWNNRIRKVDAAGTITTVAGNGTAGFCGDGGAATDACLNYPTGVTVDAAGTIFIADLGNHRVRRVDEVTGVITTVAGNGDSGFCGDGELATNACLAPTNVAVDAAGTLFIVDYGNNRIRKVDAAGTITTVAGNGRERFCGDGRFATQACLRIPWGIAVAASGDLFIADTYNDRIRRVDTMGRISTVAGSGIKGYCGDGGPATNACLSYPVGVTVDAAGTLFIADMYNNRIRKVDAHGTITTVAGDGSPGFCGDGGDATRACLWEPYGVATDAAGALFIADWGNNRVRRVPLGLALLTMPRPLVSGCRTTVGKVTLSVPAPPGGTLVTLESDNVHAVVPPSVTVKRGRVSRTFSITTSAVAGLETATITASGPAGSPWSATLTLRPMTPLSVSLSPNPVVGGNAVGATVTLECGAGPGDILVTLASGKPAVAAPATPTVTVLMGSTSAVFTVTTNAVTAVKRASIKATANGVTKSKTLIVNPGS